MVWQHKGLILAVDGSIDWMHSHVQTPTVLVLPDRLRVYFATRTHHNQSQVACIDLNKQDPRQVICLYPKPVLTPGNPGTFDSDGVMPSSVVAHQGRLYLYYTGWNQRVSVPYHNAIGVAESVDGGRTFQRLYEGPILDRTHQEPYVAITPYVLVDSGHWQMWYASGTHWHFHDNQYQAVYVLKMATSQDGIHWHRAPEALLKSVDPNEAICRPCVIKAEDEYHLWYCYRTGRCYRIGYAHRQALEPWTRQDTHCHIEASADGWDSTMQCYPYVVSVDDYYYMFYNGNDYGKSGMGFLQVSRNALNTSSGNSTKGLHPNSTIV